MPVEKFANHRIHDFARKLASGDPTPGGGTAAALAGMLAASLLEMVARIALKKKPESEGLGELLASLPSIAAALTDLMDEDSAAYDSVTTAYRLPKVTDAEKAARSEAIQRASIEAARVPLRTARACAELLDRIASIASEIPDGIRSDWTVSRELARAGLVGGLANVEINLPSIKNPAVAEELRSEATELRSRLG